MLKRCLFISVFIVISVWGRICCPLEAGKLSQIEFYKLNKQSPGAGDYIGRAELDDSGKVILSINDPELTKILTSPYKTLTGEKKDGVLIQKEIVYVPGTEEHLRAVARECYRFGYIAKRIVNK